MAGLLADAFAALPGELALVDAPPVEAVDAAGRAIEIAHGRHLHLTVRPEAPLQLLLTGHMDTVFAVDHPFQETRWIDEATINGPGTADMKGGIAVMLAALQAVEASPLAARIGYEVVDQQRRGSRQPVLGAVAGSGRARQARGLDLRALGLARWDTCRRTAGKRQFRDHHPRAIGARRTQSRGRAQRPARRRRPRASPRRRQGAGAQHQPVADRGREPDQCRPRPRHPARQHAPRDARAIRRAARRCSMPRSPRSPGTHEVAIDCHGGFSRPPKPMTPEAEALFTLVKQGRRRPWPGHRVEADRRGLRRQ